MPNDIVSRLIERFFPPVGFRAVLLGLGAAGKTTLLYRMKLGQVVQTIPSIGFNVEDVKLHTSTAGGRTLNLTCWDIGGCSHTHMLGLFAIQAAYADAIFWMIDSTLDREWFKESIDEFSNILQKVDADTTVGLKERPILVLATKQDLQNHLSLDEIRIRVAPALAGRQWLAVGLTLTTSLTDGPLVDAFAWLQNALTASVAGKSDATVRPKTTTQPAPEPSSAMETWLARADNDSPDDVFLHQFDTLSLSAWDHYTHIRIAFVLLKKFGRQEGKDKIFDGLKRYITHAPPTQTNGRTFHLTMTYFWIQLVHFGIQSMPRTTHVHTHPLADSDSDAGDFLRFLLVNPYVADGALWAEYYSKDVMMSQEAKRAMVLPDLKPLPNLVVRDAIAIGRSR
ncbi:ADP-ribosylation factor [Mycena amicta]|nr:ADP-ribosylation factor [Mycena amicta]